MSAFIGVYTDNWVCMGTDTLVRHPTGLNDRAINPKSFASKVYHLPQFKSAFGVTGYQQLGVAFYLYLHEHCIGTDINSIWKIPVKLFIAYLNEHFDQKVEGTIYLYGIDANSNLFKAYQLPVYRNDELSEWNILRNYNDDGAFCIRPAIDVEDWHKADDAVAGDIHIETLITELIKIQKVNDERRPVIEQVGIGGEIIITNMQFGVAGFSVSSRVVHKFEDFDHNFLRMMTHIGARPNG
jgi:hypothetical protein